MKVVRTSAPMAAKSVGKSAANTAGDTRKGSPPTYEEIAKRSYELYLARGGIDGHDVEDWLRAEADLLG